MKSHLVLSCPHATNFVPQSYRHLFPAGKVVGGKYGRVKVRNILADHWGVDIGALSVAQYVSKKTRVPLARMTVSRLLIEGNRYMRRSLFSPDFTMKLSAAEQAALKAKYWQPFVDEIQSHIEALHGKPALHVAIHSFTPVWKGVERTADLGVLYDTRRPRTKKYGQMLQQKLQELLPELRVRRNYPYPGWGEGLPLYYQQRFSDKQYVGIDLETNNKHLRRDTAQKREIMEAIAQALRWIQTV